MPDTKISGLTAVTTPALTDEFPVNQGGTSKKMTLAQAKTDPLSTVADAGPTETLDLATATVFDITLTESCTISLSGATANVACSLTVLVRQGGAGGWTLTWPGSVAWVGGAVPYLSPDGLTIYTLLTVDGGTTWLGFPTGAASFISCKVFGEEAAWADTTPGYLDFDTQTWDTSSMWAVSPDPDKIYAPVAGIYRCDIQVYWNPGTWGVRNAAIWVNNSVDPFIGEYTANADEVEQSITGLLSMSAGDYIQLALTQISGGTLYVAATVTLTLVNAT
jgi:hypothetical protein